MSLNPHSLNTQPIDRPTPAPALLTVTADAATMALTLRLRSSQERWARVHQALRGVQNLARACAYLDGGVHKTGGEAEAIDRELAAIEAFLDAEGTRLTIELSHVYIRSTPRHAGQYVLEKSEANVHRPLLRSYRGKEDRMTRDVLLQAYALHGTIRRMAIALQVHEPAVYRALKRVGLTVEQLREYRP